MFFREEDEDDGMDEDLIQKKINQIIEKFWG
jgi:hypothetical protein